MNAASLAFARSNARPRSYSFDLVLLMTVGSILLLGLVMMTSASITIADRQVHEPLYYLERQGTGVLLGLLAAILAMSIPTNVWERVAIPLLVLAFVFLIIVLIPGVGHEVNGSRRWLRMGAMNFQASELARVLLLMYLASYVVRRQSELKENIKGFLKPLGILIGAGGLLLLEPDFGAATVLMSTGLGILFIAGVKLRHFIALVTIAAAGLALPGKVVPHGRDRPTAARACDPVAPDPHHRGRPRGTRRDDDRLHRLATEDPAGVRTRRQRRAVCQ